MNVSLKSVPLAAAIALFTVGTGSASAALNEGTDGSSNSSVFISLAERNSLNQVVRNLVIDTGARALDVFAGTPWSTTAAQEAFIQSFVASAAVTSSIVFNVGGALTDSSFATDLQGFLTTGNAVGPAIDGFSALSGGVGTTIAKISNANNGTFNANGVLTANIPSDPGFHGNGWGDDYGGTIQPSNEVLLGAANQIIGWKLGDLVSFEIIRSQLGSITSNLQTGDISFNATVVPVPAAAWLLVSALGTLAGLRRTASRPRTPEAA
jgi:hypothetical protein